MKTKHRRIDRSRRRGAAMVEGIVVMTTMLVFLGTNVWAAKAYGGKLDQASETRRDVLYYASHSCEEKLEAGEIGTASEGIDQEGTSDALQRGASTSDDKTGNGAESAINRSWNTASTSKESSVSGYGVITIPRTARDPLSAQLRTSSWATCNEKRYDSPWTALFKFGWDFLKSGAGLG